LFILFWLSGASQFHSPNIAFLFEFGLTEIKPSLRRRLQVELTPALSGDCSPHRAWRRGDFGSSKGMAAGRHFLEKLALIRFRLLWG
jgi:hypothetical protein